MLTSILDSSKEFIQNELRRIGDHLRTRNVLQFISMSIAIALLIFWHVVVALTAYEAFKYEEITWTMILILWAAGLFMMSIVALALLKIYFLNWSWERAKQDIKLLPGALRFVTVMVIAVWAFAKLLLFVDQKLPVYGYFGDLELPAALAELDILLPFGVIGAILLLLRRSDSQNIIAGLKKASPEERMQIFSILDLEKSKKDRFLLIKMNPLRMSSNKPQRSLACYRVQRTNLDHSGFRQQSRRS